MERSANDVDFNLCTSSSCLIKPRADRIINKQLKRDIPPPWGNSTADNWRNRLERKNFFCYLLILLTYEEEAFAIVNTPPFNSFFCVQNVVSLYNISRFSGSLVMRI